MDECIVRKAVQDEGIYMVDGGGKDTLDANPSTADKKEYVMHAA